MKLAAKMAISIVKICEWSDLRKIKEQEEVDVMFVMCPVVDET